uniref:C2H2-type domain-containing protein n=1 Tax=Ananas comosus var. bracteatus TaxID=296719 RepID=A0A6V7Q5I3_ANACO|nr:unnamed protein product [Ananas comosus var. bracteatus]
MDGSSENLRNKCAACFRQYNKMEHLVEHMRVSFHSSHEPKCGVCQKHCRSFESLREHLIGRLREDFRHSRVQLVLEHLRQLERPSRSSHCMPIFPHFSKFGFHLSNVEDEFAELDGQLRRTQGLQVVALACKMVGGGSDGSLDLCARVCLVGEDESIVFHTYIKPQIPVTNYRYETTGIRPEHFRGNAIKASTEEDSGPPLQRRADMEDTVEGHEGEDPRWSRPRPRPRLPRS